MRILALQLKRIGDVVLTTPALAALRARWPDAHLALAVSEGCAPLLGAIKPISAGIVFGPDRGWAPWQQALAGAWDLCLDFTGSDRSALATALAHGRDRVTFAWVRRHKWRAFAYRRFVESSVRDRHTADHYLDLAVDQTGVSTPAPTVAPELHVNDAAHHAADELLHAHGVRGPFALLHPGTARAEKFWRADRWAEVANLLASDGGLEVILTCGPDPAERAHVEAIQHGTQSPRCRILLPRDLLTLAALVQRARLMISCDTAAVHFGAAFRTPQIALFGPTNPFHWRPRHDRAMILSAAHPDAPLTEFHPRMKAAPMEQISTALVIRATQTLLASHS